jgi:hypothetical protein
VSFIADHRVHPRQLTWMEPMLAAGELQGKIVCPNQKCGAKIGSYDWAGVQCGCKEWVVPVSIRAESLAGRSPADRRVTHLPRGFAFLGARSTRCGDRTVGSADIPIVTLCNDISTRQKPSRLHDSGQSCHDVSIDRSSIALLYS